MLWKNLIMGLLRFYLAACVMFAHTASFPFPIGISPQSAVMIFFIISGFYMAILLNKIYIGPGSKFAFYFNRFFRLWPIFIIITLCTMMAPIFISNYTDNPNNWIWPGVKNGSISIEAAIIISISNFFMVLQDWQFYFSQNLSHGFVLLQGFSGGKDLFVYDYVPQAWSLGVEISFYIVAPLIVRNVRLILLTIIASLLLNLYWMNIGASFSPWRYMFLPSVIYLFMLGAFAYHLWMGNWIKSLNKQDILLMVITVFIIILTSMKLNNDGEIYRAYLPLQFMAIAFFIPLLFMLTKNWKYDYFIGELSYPIYLCHLLILHIAKAFDVQGDGKLVIAISLLFSILLVVAVDLPMHRWRHRMSAGFMNKNKTENIPAAASKAAVA